MIAHHIAFVKMSSVSCFYFPFEFYPIGDDENDQKTPNFYLIFEKLKQRIDEL